MASPAALRGIELSCAAKLTVIRMGWPSKGTSRDSTGVPDAFRGDEACVWGRVREQDGELFASGAREEIIGFAEHAGFR